jgi:hypothetical protein
MGSGKSSPVFGAAPGRGQRLSNEYRRLIELASINSTLLQVFARESHGAYDDIPFRLTDSPAVLKEEDRLSVAASHEGVLRFPMLFPSMPIEAYLARPVFHPNVDPFTGFMCLWERYSPTYTGAEALQQVRRILSWDAVNLGAVHLLQPHARTWLEEGRIPFSLPLPSPKLVVPQPQLQVRIMRRRLVPG